MSTGGDGIGAEALRYEVENGITANCLGRRAGSRRTRSSCSRLREATVWFQLAKMRLTSFSLVISNDRNFHPK